MATQSTIVPKKKQIVFLDELTASRQYLFVGTEVSGRLIIVVLSSLNQQSATF